MRLSPAISRIAAALDSASSHDGVALARALEAPVAVSDLPACARRDADCTRIPLCEGRGWALQLLRFAPGQGGPLHTHGQAATALRVVRGTATEFVLGSGQRCWTADDIVQPSGRHAHQLSNDGPGELLCLCACSAESDAPIAPARSVLIVGGGFSGAALAYHLLKRGDARLRVTVIERTPSLGLGVAYSVQHPVFKLNVPAGWMSLDPALPADFMAYADAEPHAFVSRVVFGAYVADRLSAMIGHSASSLHFVRGEAVACDERGVQLADGTRLRADRVVLATGISAAPHPALLPDVPCVVDAWDEAGLARLANSGRLLVLGSGLSALDVLAYLHARGQRDEIVVVSRHGLWPRPHLESLKATRLPPLPDEPPRQLRALMRWVRGFLRDLERRGIAWQLGVDALRPHIPDMWQSLSARDRARFAHTVRPYWEVLRHRAPRDELDLLERLQLRGLVRTHAGSVLECKPAPQGCEVRLRLRGGERVCERFAAIVRCLGPAPAAAELGAPLLAGLVSSGAATLEPAGLGLALDRAGRLIDRAGAVDGRLFALGPLCRAMKWESTAVPDISRDAAELAQLLCAA